MNEFKRKKFLYVNNELRSRYGAVLGRFIQFRVCDAHNKPLGYVRNNCVYDRSNILLAKFDKEKGIISSPTGVRITTIDEVWSLIDAAPNIVTVGFWMLIVRHLPLEHR